MGRSWGQRLLFKCNWILLEGSLVPNPYSRAGRTWEQGYLEGTSKSDFLSEQRKKESIILNSFYAFFNKEKRNAWFIFVSFRKRKKECISLNLFFVLFRKNAKERAFLNSAFLFAAEGKKEICHTKLILHFLVGQRTMKSAEILFLENWFFRKVHAPNMPSEFDSSFPGRSKDDEISWNSFSRKLIF